MIFERCHAHEIEPMPKKTESLEEQRERLKAKQKKELEQINARIKDAKARERAAERKRETRRKVIMGGLVQKHVKANPNSEMAKLMVRLIDEYVTGDTERALFDLEPLSKP